MLYRNVLLVICGICVGCTHANRKAKPTDIQNIVIHYVSSSVETPITISCDRFDSYFGIDDYREEKMFDKQKLGEFSDCLDQHIVDTAYSSVDVRARILVNYLHSSQSVIYLDRFGHTLRDYKFSGLNEGMIEFIYKNCKGFK